MLVKSINILQRLAGAGYRVRSRLMSTQRERIKAVKRKIQYQRMQLPMIGRGMPLNPEN